MRLTFDSAIHEYRLSGRRLPSVTQVLKGVGMIDFSMIPSDILQAAARLGTAVHEALCYFDDGELDEETVPLEIEPYVEAYSNFRAHSGFQPALIEQRVYHPTYLYAGTLDRTGQFQDGSKAVLDFKTGVPFPAHALQLAAYQACLQHPRQYRRISLYLDDEGSYRVVEYPAKDYERDWSIFLNALACWNWQLTNQTGRAA